MSNIDYMKLNAIFSRNEPAWLKKQKADDLAYEEDEDFEADDETIVASIHEKIDIAMRYALHSMEYSIVDSTYRAFSYILDLLVKKSPEYNFDAAQSLGLYPALAELDDAAKKTIIEEVRSTLFFIKSYGENIQSIYHSARKQERFIDELMSLDEIVNTVFTGEDTSTLEKAIRCGGTHLRLRYIVLFMTYEDRFSLNHLKQYAQIKDALETQSEADVNSDVGNGAATLHRLLKVSNGGPDQLSLAQRFEVSLTIIGWMEAYEVFVNVDTSNDSVWETTSDLFHWSQDHDIENLMVIGPVMSHRGHGTTLIILNPTSGEYMGHIEEDAEMYLRKNNKHETNFIYSSLSRQDY